LFKRCHRLWLELSSTESTVHINKFFGMLIWLSG
jgi:hypothetical protein